MLIPPDRGQLLGRAVWKVCIPSPARVMPSSFRSSNGIFRLATSLSAGEGSRKTLIATQTIRN